MPQALKSPSIFIPKLLPPQSVVKPLAREASSNLWGDSVRKHPGILAQRGSTVGKTLETLKELNERTAMQGPEGPTHDAGHTLPVSKDAMDRMLEDDKWERCTNSNWGDVDGDIEVYFRVSSRIYCDRLMLNSRFTIATQIPRNTTISSHS